MENDPKDTKPVDDSADTVMEIAALQASFTAEWGPLLADAAITLDGLILDTGYMIRHIPNVVTALQFAQEVSRSASVLAVIVGILAGKDEKAFAGAVRTHLKALQEIVSRADAAAHAKEVRDAEMKSPIIIPGASNDPNAN